MLPRRRLLISFQSAAELDSLRDFQPDWIDLKSPTRGSLGCPQFSEAKAFVEKVEQLFPNRDFPVSLAMGELSEGDWRAMKGIAIEFDYVKVGLAGARRSDLMIDSLFELIEHLEVKRRLVLAHYADFDRADSPDWNEVLDAATQIDSPFILIDTFDKQAGRLWDYLSPEQINERRQAAHKVGIELAVAGSVRLDELAKLKELGVAIVGVRGAVCEFGSRNRPVDRARLLQAAETFAGIDRVAT